MAEKTPSSLTRTSTVHIEKTVDSTSTFTRCETPSINLRPSDCEMQTLDRNDATSQDHVQDTTTYPRVDGGKDAWLFLAGCFVFEALVWGFPFSFGVFESYYTTHAPFSKHGGIAAIGTCSSGVMYLWAPVSLYILERWPSIRRLSSVFGLCIVVVALVASSFATKIWQLILTQGVLYAIGGSFLYAPTMFYLDDWFVKKKGLASGCMWAGVGTSGLIFPFLLNYLLTTHGHATTLRIWSLLLILLCSPLIHYIKPRLPPPSPPPPPQNPSYTFLFKSRTHFFLQASNILESLGFFIPAIYLPSYASSLSLPHYSGTLLLSTLNISSVLGAIAMGALCDRLHVVNVILISSLGAIFSIFVFWGLGTSLGMLVVFTTMYGVFAGGYSAIWSGMMREVKRDRGGEGAGMGTLMGVFAAGRGVGNLVCGPVSEVLLGLARERGYGVASSGGGAGGGGFGYGTEYGVLIVFTGVSAACGLVAFGARWNGNGRGDRKRGDEVVVEGGGV